MSGVAGVEVSGWMTQVAVWVHNVDRYVSGWLLRSVLVCSEKFNAVRCGQRFNQNNVSLSATDRFCKSKVKMLHHRAFE